MLKLKLTPAEHGTLPDPLKAEYKQEGDSYVLDTDVKFEDTGALRNALVQEKANAKKLQADKQVLEGQVIDLTARAGTAGDLEKSWQAKVDAAKTQYENDTKGLKAQINTLLIDNVANQLAAEISTAPSLMAPAIKGRLTVDIVDGQYITRVLTPDGKASALSVKELAEELRANKEFAPIISASKASGGGANGNKGPVSDKPFADMNENERTTLFRTDRPKFDRLAAEFQSQPKPAPGAPAPQPKT